MSKMVKNSKLARVKFMQTCTDTHWKKLKQLADNMEITVQEYIRIFILTPYLHNIKYTGKQKPIVMSRSDKIKASWVERRKKYGPTGQNKRQSTFNPNIPPLPPDMEKPIATI